MLKISWVSYKKRDQISLIVPVPLLPPPEICQQLEGLSGCYVDMHLHLKTQHLVLLQSVQTDLEHHNIHHLSMRT